MSFLTTEINKWSNFFNLNKKFLNPFIFRGQSNKEWDLATSLERSVTDYSWLGHDRATGLETEEKWMLHEFKRNYHRFSNSAPNIDDSFEWLAIMQHYGSPTRLLDFTESFFIATYFAIIDSKSDAAVWAINRWVLRDKLKNVFSLNYNNSETLKDEVNDIHIQLANKFIAHKYTGNSDPNSVIPLEPKTCSERLAKQQGLFLMPTNTNETFMNNIIDAFQINKEAIFSISFNSLINESHLKNLSEKVFVVKFIIPKELHWEILDQLYYMNITADTLFPGIEGLAKSLFHRFIRI
jgi:hypothetical protein